MPLASASNEARDRALVFRQHPGWPVFMATLVVLIGGVALLALGDPDFRAAVYLRTNPLTSPKFLVVTALIGLGWYVFGSATRLMWRSAWEFEITPDRLLATHPFTGRRREIGWSAIASVTRLPYTLATWPAPMRTSRIEVTEGDDLLFTPLMPRYPEFVEALRSRVTCRVFDPARWPLL
jgi:hypothetical protein